MATLNSAEEAAAWARQSLPAKNSLTAADARMVEQRFQARLRTIGDRGETPGGAMAVGLVPEGTIADPLHAVPDQSAVSAGSAAADRGGAAALTRKPPRQQRRTAVGPLGKTVRLRDKDHRRFMLRQACLVCGRVPSDPHHLTFTQPRALGRRVSDEFIVPVCRGHHRELHRSGDEAAWWRMLNIDPVPIALKLWQHTQGNGEVSASSEAVAHAKTADAPEQRGQSRAVIENGHSGAA